jgi:hypothetical protein
VNHLEAMHLIPVGNHPNLIAHRQLVKLVFTQSRVKTAYGTAARVLIQFILARVIMKVIALKEAEEARNAN